MKKICAIKVKIITFFWRLLHWKLWHSSRKELVIPKNTPFCFKITEKGKIYVCSYLVSISEGDCCMYKAEYLKRRAEKICGYK